MTDCKSALNEKRKEIIALLEILNSILKSKELNEQQNEFIERLN
jgi:hypothetical protein